MLNGVMKIRTPDSCTSAMLNWSGVYDHCLAVAQKWCNSKALNLLEKKYFMFICELSQYFDGIPLSMKFNVMAI